MMGNMMGDIMQKIYGSKLAVFLNRIDFTLSLFCILWSFLLVWYSVFMDYQYLVFDIPPEFAGLCVLPVSVAAIGIKRYYEKEKTDLKRALVYVSCNGILPGIYNLVMLFFGDLLYDYSGVFLGGIGQFVFRIAFLILSAVFIAVFWLIRYLRKQKAGHFDLIHEKMQKLRSIINLLLFTILVLALIILAIVYFISRIQELAAEKETERKEAFIQEMNEKLSEFPDQDSILLHEAVACMLLTESYEAAPSEIKEIEQENGNLFQASTVSYEPFRRAIEAYHHLLAEYQPQAAFSSVQPDFVYDADERRVSAVFTTTCSHGKKPAVDCSFSFVYDENWNLTDAFATVSEP